MLKKAMINLSFKDRVDENGNPISNPSITPTESTAPNNLPNLQNQSEQTSENSSDNKTKNCWSGYHVRFRNPRNFQEYAIDKEFNRWGDMVEFFSQQERPYKLSQGSLKDLLYGTYKRKGMHSLSLNDLVTIEKIERTRITKTKTQPTGENETKEEAKTEENTEPQVMVQAV